MHDVNRDGPHALYGENYVFGNNSIRPHYEAEDGTALSSVARGAQDAEHTARAFVQATPGGDVARPGTHEFEARLREACMWTGAHPADVRMMLEGASRSTPTGPRP